MILQEATPEAIAEFGRKILHHKYDEKTLSFETISQNIVENVYENFRDKNEKPAFALVRIFRLCKVSELPPEQEKPPTNDSHFLCLMGTKGQENAWSNRLESVGHGIIPPSAFETPMLKAAFEQINLPYSKLGDTQEFMKQEHISNRYFHVETALNSPYIVAQEEFVKPYNIKSVIGIGSVFVSHSFGICIAFSKEPIDEAAAKKFAGLSPYIMTQLARCDAHHPVWKV